MNIIRMILKAGREVTYIIQHPITAPKHKSGRVYRIDGRTHTKPSLKSPAFRAKRKIHTKMAKVSRRINRR